MKLIQQLFFILVAAFTAMAVAANDDTLGGGPSGMPCEPGSEECPATYLANSFSVDVLASAESITIGDDELEALFSGMPYAPVFEITVQPARGSVSINPNGLETTFVFSLNGDFDQVSEGLVDEVTFSFMIMDEELGEFDQPSTGTITVRVEGVAGEEPTPEVTANTFTVSVAESATIIIGDDENEALFSGMAYAPMFYILEQPAKGVLTQSEIPDVGTVFTFDPDGQFNYLVQGETETVSFTYSVRDLEMNTEPSEGVITVEVQGEGQVIPDAVEVSTQVSILDNRAQDELLNEEEIVQVNARVTEADAGSYLEITSLPEGLSIYSTQSSLESSEDTQSLLVEWKLLVAKGAVGELSDLEFRVLDANENTMAIEAVELPAVHDLPLNIYITHDSRENWYYSLVIDLGSQGFDSEDSWMINVTGASGDVVVDCDQFTTNTFATNTLGGNYEKSCDGTAFNWTLTGIDNEDATKVYFSVRTSQEDEFGESIDWQINATRTLVTGESIEYSFENTTTNVTTFVDVRKVSGDEAQGYIVNVSLKDVIQTREESMYLSLVAGFEQYPDEFKCDTLELSDGLKASNQAVVTCLPERIDVYLPENFSANIEGDIGSLFNVGVLYHDIDKGKESGKDIVFHVFYSLISGDDYYVANKEFTVLRDDAEDSLGIIAAVLAILSLLFYQRRKKVTARH